MVSDGGLHHVRGELVHEGETISRTTNPFKADATVVEAPFTGLLVGVFENPVVYPSNPLCHLAKIDETQVEIIDGRDGQPHE